MFYTSPREDYTVCFVECECLRGCKVFDRFRNWRNIEEVGKLGTECQHKNSDDAVLCSLCQYQLKKASFQQDSNMNEEIASDLFDELLGDFEEEESEDIIDWSKTTFQIDDVTIDVQQYDDDDGIIVSQNPSFALTVDHPEPIDEEEEDFNLAQSLLEWMELSKADYTSTFRDLTYENLSKKEIYKSLAFEKWHSLWQARLSRNSKPIKFALNTMRKCNPVIVPYNHLVEEALSAAEEEDMQPFYKLLSALEKPFEFSSSNEGFLNSTPDPNPHYQTFCGT